LDSLRGSSVKIGTIQRRLAWPLRKDDTHKSRSVSIFCPWPPRRHGDDSVCPASGILAPPPPAVPTCGCFCDGVSRRRRRGKASVGPGAGVLAPPPVALSSTRPISSVRPGDSAGAWASESLAPLISGAAQEQPGPGQESCA